MSCGTFISWRRAEAMLLAEANITMDQVDEYFGRAGDRLHMIFNFMLNQHLFWLWPATMPSRSAA